jgi:hypothetical protein
VQLFVEVNRAAQVKTLPNVHRVWVGAEAWGEGVSVPVWFNVTVKLSDLKPWADNPRLSTKAQAKRLLASFEKFGQVQTVAIGPNLEVYDGHQRLSALLTIHGNGYTLDARQSDRELTDDERRELVVTLHAGAVGSWNSDALAGWDAAKVIEWGMDAETLTSWKRDTSMLERMLESETPVPEFKEYDESAADEVEYLTCPHCGKSFPK